MEIISSYLDITSVEKWMYLTLLLDVAVDCIALAIYKGNYALYYITLNRMNNFDFIL